MNGVLKDEFGLSEQLGNISEAIKQTAQSINIYNNSNPGYSGYRISVKQQVVIMTGDIAYKIKSIASNIRRIREGKGYTQEYLAMKLGISQNAYSKIELGYTKITLERLFHIARLIETDIISLIVGIDGID